ncbi:MAG: hypothetical protein OXC57_04920 [Rhodobacteraceae bacterium]|nr:hypothetical protein [Paracoccaceae bacterium]
MAAGILILLCMNCVDIITMGGNSADHTIPKDWKCDGFRAANLTVGGVGAMSHV